MLKHWQTHAEYQQFISEAVALLNPSQLKKLHSMSDSWNKLTSMNLDPVGDFLAPFYSATGRPALNQPQILRSFILMLDRKFTSLTNWVCELQGDDLLAMLIGCSPDHLPPLGSYFDFITASGSVIRILKNPDVMTCFRLIKTGNLLPNRAMAKNSQTVIQGLPKQSLILPCPNMNSLFTMKRLFNSCFPLLPLSLPLNLD